MSDADELFQAVLARALELRDRGHEDWLAMATEEHPVLAGRVAEAAKASDGLMSVLVGGSPQDGNIGRLIGGRFRLRARAGSGAMGVVYQAQDEKLGRPVAVKIVHGQMMLAADTRQRFEREASASAKVRHPALVTLHDFGETAEDDPYLVMEWLDGVSASDLIQEAGRLPAPPTSSGWISETLDLDVDPGESYVRTVVGWGRQLAEGLAVIHGAGILHRDIKPSNLIVRRDGSAVLFDFGLALEEGTARMTRLGGTVGTPAYMPPESLGDERQRTARSDVYSLGATLYHLLTLRAPFEGTPVEVLAAIATRDPIPAAFHRPGLSRDVQAVVEKAMHRRPGARYGSASELAADLTAILEHGEVRATLTPSWVRATRRWARTWWVRGAAAAAVGALLFLGVDESNARARRARVRASHEVLAHLPPSFSVLEAERRRIRDDGARGEVERGLDRLVALDVEAVRGLLLRSSLRLDHSDPAGAAEDMAALARELDTPLAAELARRYAAAPADAVGHSALDLVGLPDPQDATDRYLLGYHALRAGEEAQAFEWLDDPQVLQRAHARELRFVSIPLAGRTPTEQRALAWETLLDLREHTAAVGRDTATSLHLTAWLSAVLGRFSEAGAAAEAAAELCPWDHNIRVNAAYAALSTGQTDRALAHLDVAVMAAPGYRRLLLLRVWALEAEGRFDEALAAIDAAALEGDDDERFKLVQRSQVETLRALSARAAGDAEGEQQAVERAATLVVAAQELGGINFDDPLFLILEAIFEERPGSIPTQLLDLAAGTPLHSWRLKRVLEHLPEDLDATQSEAVRRYLEALSGVLDQPVAQPAPPLPGGSEPDSNTAPKGGESSSK